MYDDLKKFLQGLDKLILIETLSANIHSVLVTLSLSKGYCKRKHTLRTTHSLLTGIYLADVEIKNAVRKDSVFL